MPIFWSLGDHPIQGDSEARYGVIARAMARGESPLLVPHLFGDPHLTKPPLTYWLMAASIRLLGDGELGLRMPAALSGAAALGVCFAFARRRYGRGTAVLATATLSVTPLFVAMSRLGTTDSHLGLFCSAALAAGVLAVRERRRRWAACLWAATALGLLTKGPAALLPAAALTLWVAWRRPAGGLKALRLGAGLPLSLLPLGLWAGWVAWARPEAWAVWRFETFSRAAGTGDHPEPWWFFGPVALFGLLPSSVALSVWLWKWWRATKHGQALGGALRPGMNSDHLRADAPIWGVMLVLTFVVFSCIRGKLMSYLLPMAFPAAMVFSYLITYKIIRYKLDVLATNSAAYGLKAVWTLALLALVVFTIVEDKYFGTHPPAELVDQVRRHTGLAHPVIYSLGFIDRRLPYYTDRPTRRLDPRVMPEAWKKLPKEDLVLVATPSKWEFFAADPNWDLTQRYERLDLELRLGHDPPPLRAYRIRPEFW